MQSHANKFQDAILVRQNIALLDQLKYYDTNHSTIKLETKRIDKNKNLIVYEIRNIIRVSHAIIRLKNRSYNVTGLEN